MLSRRFRRWLASHQFVGLGPEAECHLVRILGFSHDGQGDDLGRADAFAVVAKINVSAGLALGVQFARDDARGPPRTNVGGWLRRRCTLIVNEIGEAHSDSDVVVPCRAEPCRSAVWSSASPVDGARGSARTGEVNVD